MANECQCKEVLVDPCWNKKSSFKSMLLGSDLAEIMERGLGVALDSLKISSACIGGKKKKKKQTLCWELLGKRLKIKLPVL